MIDLKKLLKGLPIKIDGNKIKSCDDEIGRETVDGVCNPKRRNTLTSRDVAETIGWRVILAAMAEYEEPCKDCEECAKHSYSDTTTPGFFYDKCNKHREPKPATSGSASPYCVEHNCRMVLSVYERPGSPSGNAWSCPECEKERESKVVNPGQEFEELKEYTILECAKERELKPAPTWEGASERDTEEVLEREGCGDKKKMEVNRERQGVQSPLCVHIGPTLPKDSLG